MVTFRRSRHSGPSGSHVGHHLKRVGAQKPVTHMSVPDSTSQHLEYLREAYIYKANAALERGREDLASELAEDYLDEVRSTLEVASHPRG
jgi:phage shock protein A